MRSSVDQHIVCTTRYTILKVSILHKLHWIQWPTQHWANQSKDTVTHREAVNQHPIAGRYHALFKIHCISFQSTKRLGRHLWWNRNPLLFLRALNQIWQGTKYNVQFTSYDGLVLRSLRSSTKIRIIERSYVRQIETKSTRESRMFRLASLR
jgi:hypothetical protein